MGDELLHHLFFSPRGVEKIEMSDQQTESAEQLEEPVTDNTASSGPDKQDHDCQKHLEFADYEWAGEAWDETYVCDVCGEEFVDVYLHAFRLDSDDYSLVDEYTDEIQRKLEQHQNHEPSKKAESEESADK